MQNTNEIIWHFFSREEGVRQIDINEFWKEEICKLFSEIHLHWFEWKSAKNALKK